MSDWIGVAYIFGGMVSLYAVARAQKFDPDDRLIIQIAVAFVFWPLVLPLVAAASVGRNPKGEDREGGLRRNDEHAVAATGGETPKRYRP